MNRRLIPAIFLFFALLVSAQEADMNCFAILAGRLATDDGSVMLAHNEDDGGEQMLNLYVVPRDAAKGTNKYIWAEFPGMSVADSYMNEYGVCIVSDGCNSREDTEDYTDGGVLYEVRESVAQKAVSARDAVRIIGDMVERYGYRGSGRTYVVADPKEGWICSVVKGRHWVAQRVPDDKVMCIPNYYTITDVNLSDTSNFMGSVDIVDYAVSRGWYDPDSGNDFNFRLAYHAPATFERPSNAWRHEAVIHYLTAGHYSYSVEGVQPMWTPVHPISLSDMMNMLALHRETGEYGHPANVCTSVTILASVFHLRGWLPPEIGCVMWNCPGHPCAELFSPWYCGLEATPSSWRRYDSAAEAREKHFYDTDDKQSKFPRAACWHYVNRWKELESDYDNRIDSRIRVKTHYQPVLFEMERKKTQKLKHQPKESWPAHELRFVKRCARLSQK